MKRFTAMLLAFVLMISGLNGFGTKEAKAAEPEYIEVVHVNPLYADIADEEMKVPRYALMTLTEPDYVTDIHELAAQIREAMVNREPSVEVYYKTKTELDRETFLSDWLAVVFEDLENPKAGDYLERHYEKVGGRGAIKQSGDWFCYEFVLSMEYYTTAEQEAELDVEVDRVLKQIGVSKSLSDYENLKKIYDYICENITYDYEHLANPSYDLMYTAYAAMINKTAVCQGYASLFYYMARKSGLDVRTISGYADNGVEIGPHGWNIAKVDEWYYNLDSTWDAGSTRYSYFLVGSRNFQDHMVEDDYDDDFWKKHPLSKIDYDPANVQEPFRRIDLSKAQLKTLAGEEFVMQDFQYDENPKIQSGFVVYDENGHVIDKSNYDISYKNNINYGVATLTITGKGEYCTGSLVKTFEIYKASIEKLTFELSSTRYVYDGSVKKPKVIVKTPSGVVLKEGTDYWVTFKTNCIDKGTHEVKVTVDNNYRGVETLEFQIVPQGEWIKDYVGWWYKRADGTYPKNGWALIDTDWYYFNASGYRVTGWVKTGGTWYYLMEEGNREEMQDWVNPDVGKMLHGDWFGDKDGKTYYFQENGAMKTGWLLYRGEWYYFNNSGALQKGWQLVGGIWYYFEETGKMSIGWQQIKGTWYYFNGSGAMVVGWQAIRGVWYYFHGSGAMAANQWVGNYYLQTDGSMAVNKRIGIYYVGADGAWIPGR